MVIVVINICYIALRIFQSLYIKHAEETQTLLRLP